MSTLVGGEGLLVLGVVGEPEVQVYMWMYDHGRHTRQKYIKTEAENIDG